ncbi:hypothetical protein [Streptomyces sp. H34-S4]|nr:hypothetical protein [Streptomyces sp. H34-S4]MCY0939306.1 hypothetical protein [Streptomyces sp. H34-S4]
MNRNLLPDSHAATQSADIYNLGQLIGRAITGTMPQMQQLSPSGSAQC